MSACTTVVLVIAAIAAVLIVQAGNRAAQERGVAAAAVVQHYLESVAAGDAARALSYVHSAPASPLLTDEALTASLALAPISGIQAAPRPLWGQGGQISVRYVLGTTPVAETYDVIETRTHGAYLVAATSQLTFDDRFRGLAVTINGTVVTGESVAVFPGTYAVGIATEPFTIADPAAFPVTAPGATEIPAQVRPALTDAGVQAYRAAVTAAVDGCLASRALASGCGLDLRSPLADGTTLYDGTVFRTLSPAAQTGLSALVPELEPTDPTMATSGLIGAVTAAANCTQGAVSGECDIRDAPPLQGASVDMLQSPLTVVWASSVAP